MIKRAILGAAVAAAMLSFPSCGDPGIQRIARESLDRDIHLGSFEDEILLFAPQPRDASSGNPALGNFQSRSPETSILVRRDGSCYIANGPLGKIMKLTTHGDLVKLIANPALSPQAANVEASPYHFNELGMIAVDSSGMIFAEDKVPQERRSYDERLGALLDRVVLRFDKDGEIVDYLGQEGLGGTAFPDIVSLRVLARDELVVICQSASGWTAFFYDSRGALLRDSVHISRVDLPFPKEAYDAAFVGGVAPDVDEAKLLVIVNYSKEIRDAETGNVAGVDFAASLLWIYDLETRSYEAYEELPVKEHRDQTGVWRSSYEFLGSASGGRLFLIDIIHEPGGSTDLLVYERGSRKARRYELEISFDERAFNVFSLSNEGILSALLASRSGESVKVVWWRLDRVGEGILD
jgi:hypothetical protein